MLPNYDQCILQVIASVKKYMGLTVDRNTDNKVDRWMNSHDFKRLVVVFIDGMGAKILERQLSVNSFMRKQMLETTTTVFPSTTAAVFPSIMSGKSPYESGYLGWHQYFKEIDDSVVLFMNKSFQQNKQYPGFVKEHLPLETIYDVLGNDMRVFMPAYIDGGYKDKNDLFDRIVNSKEKLVLAYIDELDTLMHKEGPYSSVTKSKLEELNVWVESLANQLPEKTGLMVIADHGQVDVTERSLKEHPEVLECLERLPVLESRCMGIYVKEGMHEAFEKAFRDAYNDIYTLMSRDEVLSMNLLGKGNQHPRLLEFMGDYLAIGTHTVSLVMEKKGVKGDHAGILETEMKIPVIVYPK